MEDKKVKWHWILAHKWSSCILLRVFIMGPIERMKIIMQTNWLPKYHNPKSDRPKGILDLGASKYYSLLIKLQFYFSFRNINELGFNELLSWLVCTNADFIGRYSPSIYYV